MAEEGEIDIKALRAEYEAKFGKRPFPGWDAQTLTEKLAMPAPAPQPDSPPDNWTYGTTTLPDLPAAPAPDPVATTRRVVITANHVYLPEDPSQPGWEACTTTVKYEKRTKLNVAPDLAAFLESRDQAEILD